MKNISGILIHNRTTAEIFVDEKFEQVEGRILRVDTYECRLMIEDFTPQVDCLVLD